MNSSSPVIRVEDLHFSYPQGTPALRGVSLSIDPGEFIAVLGQNGSGKTTLVRHFNGLLRPTAGNVWVKGKNTRTTPVSTLAASVGYVFQNPDHQIFCNTVWEEASFGPRTLGFPREKVADNTQEALRIMELFPKADRHPHSLSRGERQRLAIASVLAVRPEVIVLDEPTGGQDKARTAALMHLLQELNRQGHTIIVISHDLDLAAEYAKRVLVMYSGTLLLNGDPHDVFREEELLSRTFLRAPDICRLSAALKMPQTALSTDEFVREVQRREGRIAQS